MKFPSTKNEQTSVKPQVKAILDRHGWFWWGGKADAFGKSGISDVLAVRPGIFMVIECKCTTTSHGKGGPTPIQLAFLNQIKEAKHLAFVVTEKTLDAFDTFLTLFEEAARYAAKGQKPPAEFGGPMVEAMNRLTNYPNTLEANI